MHEFSGSTNEDLARWGMANRAELLACGARMHALQRWLSDTLLGLQPDENQSEKLPTFSVSH